MRFLLKPCIAVLLLAAAPFSMIHADEAADVAADIKALKVLLPKHLPNPTEATVKATPVKGLFEVMSGSQIMYMTKDARYIIDGDLYDMAVRKNLTEDARGGIRLKALGKLGENNMLVYKPDGEIKHTITVFTDIYCPYCRRLHDEMNEYMKNGIKVRYIFVPFKGPKSVDASVSVWCAKDRNKALDLAKSGANIEKKTCDNPISQHQALASKLGIRGTPAIMLESGQLLPGYVPSAKLIEQLNSPETN
ncbi:Thiol:disulfide interchange protein DsbC [hydrothermal vent metagenome]|uniref:Thiol:disulfide interchange protein DsbC n=1 Tax=hydrothermal vent metagenome TaxID=652676 RepID=A0A3B0Y7W5_9ZZZZ